MLNFHYAKMWEGKMILRFDDTNPINEKGEFVENIIKDLKRLDIVPDIITSTSDHFEAIEKACRKLIADGHAYADDTPAEQMKLERDVGTESKHRANTPE
jgi:glutamyl/glutaminyl-tRNA synthetase